MPKATQTSAFGSPGRVNHDASSFYDSNLYAGLDVAQKVDYVETPLPEGCTNRILCASAEAMTDLPDNSVHLMVTSPPYNVGKEYDEDLTLADYLDFLGRVWAETQRVLVPGGRACINVANLGRKPYLPLASFISRQMIELGFHMRGEIIWNKAGSASPSTAWGSWMSPSNPTLRDVHEYILVFSKGTMRRKPPEKRTPSISRDEFLEYTKSIWTFAAEPARRVGHPAPFPVELPRRLLHLYTYAGEVILDPFMGSGQSAIAAVQTDRRYVGYEISPEYIALAEERIRVAKVSEIERG